MIGVNIETYTELIISIFLSKISILTNLICDKDILTLLCKPILSCFEVIIPINHDTKFDGARDMATNSSCKKIIEQKLLDLAKNKKLLYFILH